MREDTPSVTAQRVAERRAAHQFLDHPRVFEDPLAIKVLGAEAAEELVSAREDLNTQSAKRLRAFVAARSRYAEEKLADAIQQGATQYVVLGAGLDTFAYRNAHPPSGLKVFEIDHPVTQAWKRKRLEAAAISIPSSTVFVPLDFERTTLSAALHEAGFAANQTSFFSWLGVTPYLTQEAALATLAFVASLPAGSGVVFDYTVARSSLNSAEQMALDALASRVAKAGEPFQFLINPRALGALLRAAGFRHIEDFGPGEIDARYFKDREDGLRVSAGLAHLVHARI
jgi:methyltransferase (TIGR00027 family)